MTLCESTIISKNSKEEIPSMKEKRKKDILVPNRCLCPQKDRQRAKKEASLTRPGSHTLL
jgi:hypothetical protein